MLPTITAYLRDQIRKILKIELCIKLITTYTTVMLKSYDFLVRMAAKGISNKALLSQLSTGMRKAGAEEKRCVCYCWDSCGPAGCPVLQTVTTKATKFKLQRSQVYLHFSRFFFLFFF